jgi:hypothetical protein
MTKESPKHIEFKITVPEYEHRFPTEMAMLEIGGVYPGKKKDMINPYSGEADTEYRGNIGEHCIAVAKCAEVITKNILGEKNPQVDKIVKRALVHDATKRFEIMRKIALKADAIEDAYSPTAYETIKPLFEKQGVAPDIIDYMADAGKETGHNSLPDFVEIKNEKPVLKTSNTLSDMIVHLADNMTYTPIVTEGEKAHTEYVTFEERIDADHADFPNRYPFLYKEGFGFDQQGKAILLKDVTQARPDISHVSVYADWQAWVSKEISKHLVKQISPETPGQEAENYLKNLVNSK